MAESETKPNETKSNAARQNETKRTPPKGISLNISTDDLRRYIADGIKADTGATVADMWTNADDGFIVYGSGLGRVQ